MRNALRFLAANYYTMFCGTSSSNYCTKRQRFYPLPLFFALKRAENLFSFYRQQTADLPPIRRLAAGGGFTLDVSVHIGRLRQPGEPVFTGGNKRGQDTKHGFLPPLDSPHLPLRCHIGDVQRNGSYGSTIPGVGQISGRCYALNFPCVIRRA